MNSLKECSGCYLTGTGDVKLQNDIKRITNKCGTKKVVLVIFFAHFKSVNLRTRSIKLMNNFVNRLKIFDLRNDLLGYAPKKRLQTGVFVAMP